MFEIVFPLGSLMTSSREHQNPHNWLLTSINYQESLIHAN